MDEFDKEEIDLEHEAADAREAEWASQQEAEENPVESGPEYGEVVDVEPEGLLASQVAKEQPNTVAQLAVIANTSYQHQDKIASTLDLYAAGAPDLVGPILVKLDGVDADMIAWGLHVIGAFVEVPGLEERAQRLLDTIYDSQKARMDSASDAEHELYSVAQKSVMRERAVALVGEDVISSLEGALDEAKARATGAVPVEDDAAE